MVHGTVVVSVVAVAVVAFAGLAVTGCGGRGAKKKSSTTLAGRTGLTTTTIGLVDPAPKALLLVAGDVPGFTDQPGPVGGLPDLATCDPASAGAVEAILGEPRAGGAVLVRGAQGEVSTTSRVTSTTATKAAAALTQLLDAKLARCAERELQALVEAGAAAGAKVTVGTTAANSALDGADQVVLFDSTVTVAAAGTQTTSRFDVVFLRRGAFVLTVGYRGPSGLTSVAERQSILAAVSAKLTVGVTKPSTSVTSKITTTTRRSTPTTRRSTPTTRRSATPTSR